VDVPAGAVALQLLRLGDATSNLPFRLRLK